MVTLADLLGKKMNRRWLKDLEGEISCYAIDEKRIPNNFVDRQYPNPSIFDEVLRQLFLNILTPDTDDSMKKIQMISDLTDVDKKMIEKYWFGAGLSSEDHVKFWSKIKNNVMKKVDENPITNVDQYFGLAYDSWFGYYDFFIKTGLVDDIIRELIRTSNSSDDRDKYVKAKELVPDIKRFMGMYRKGVFSMIVFMHFVFYTTLPKSISMTANNRLNADNKPAVEWFDGTGNYYIQHVNFKKRLFDRVVAGDMKLEEIMKIDNQDQRMIALHYKKADALLKECGKNAKMIDKSQLTGYELWKIDSSVFNSRSTDEDMYLVRYTDPSTGNEHVDTVPPVVEYADGSRFSVTTADQAMAFKTSMTVENYRKMHIAGKES